MSSWRVVHDSVDMPFLLRNCIVPLLAVRALVGLHLCVFSLLVEVVRSTFEFVALLLLFHIIS